jgi:transposase-like protein
MQAGFDQQMARMRQGYASAAASIRNISNDTAAKPSARLDAAIATVSLAKDALEFIHFIPELAEVEAARKAAPQNAEEAPACERKKSPGHGAKSESKRKEAIVQLFQQRSVADAARVTGITPQTLYQWIRQPEFQCQFRAAEGDVFSNARMIFLQGVGAATSLIKSFKENLNIEPATRLKADLYICRNAEMFARHDLDARLTEAESDGGRAGNRETARESKVVPEAFYHRVKRLKASLLTGKCDEDVFDYVDGNDGRPVGPPVSGTHGLHLCPKPAEGYGKGESAETETVPVPGKVAA